MLKVENVEVLGWEHAIRGMRNPKNSWAKSDSGPECPYGKEKCCGECQQNFCIGPNDKQQLKSAIKFKSTNMLLEEFISDYFKRHPEAKHTSQAERRLKREFYLSILKRSFLRKSSSSLDN